jgi:methylmalonyl-CoA mutase, C-terminal domain
MAREAGRGRRRRRDPRSLRIPGPFEVATGPKVQFRVLVTKVGLDGHDRGVKVVARTLRDAGFEVVYGGLRQTPATVAAMAAQEDVDVVGLSMHSGGHLTLAPAVLDALEERGLRVPTVVGGIVPARDIPVLLQRGVAAVLTPGASAEEIVATMAGAAQGHRRAQGATADPSPA